MKAKVDQDTCIGCGMCVSICPQIFEMDDDIGKAVASSSDISDSDMDCAKDAEDSCPVSAITVS